MFKKRQKKIKRIFLILILGLFLFSFYFLKNFSHKVWAAPADPGNGIIIYGESGNTTPRQRTYTASTNTFAAEGDTVAGATPIVSQTKASPIKEEMIAGYVASDGTLYITCWNGTSWSNEWNVTVGGTGSTRRFDIAYELLSGDVMVVYSGNVATTNELRYRTKAGTASCGSGNWSNETNLDPVRTSGIVYWVKLETSQKQNSNNIGLAWSDENNDLSTMIWNGSSWGSESASALSTDLNYVSAVGDVEPFDIAFESRTGDFLAVWSDEGTTCTAGSNCARYIAYTTAWGSSTAVPTVADRGTHLDLASDPASSDQIILAMIDDYSADLSMGVWSGTAWTGKADQDTDCATPTAGTKFVACGWLNNGSTKRGVCPYYDLDATNVGWVVLSGTTFTTQTDWTPTPSFGTQVQYNIQVDPSRRDRLMFLVSDASSDLFAKRLVMDATPTFTWSDADGGAALEAELSSATYQAFSFAYHNLLIFDSSFEGGNARSFTNPYLDDSDKVSFESELDDGVSNAICTAVARQNWFYFKMTGVQNRSIAFTLVNANANSNEQSTWTDLKPVYSYDQITWYRITTAGTLSGVNFTFTAPGTGTFSSDTVYLAYNLPYTYTDSETDIATWDDSPYVTVSDIGNSVQGRMMHLITIQDTNSPIPASEKKVYWAIARQHPTETVTNYMINGIIDFMIGSSEEAKIMRRTSIVKLIPMMNPDGAYQGWTRDNAYLCNLNSEWSSTGANASTEATEVYNAHYAFDDWMTNGTPADAEVFFDYHTRTSLAPGVNNYTSMNGDVEQPYEDLFTLLDGNTHTTEFWSTSLSGGTYTALYSQYNASKGLLPFLLEGPDIKFTSGWPTEQNSQAFGLAFFKAAFAISETKTPVFLLEQTDSGDSTPRYVVAGSPNQYHLSFDSQKGGAIINWWDLENQIYHQLNLGDLTNGIDRVEWSDGTVRTLAAATNVSKTIDSAVADGGVVAKITYTGRLGGVTGYDYELKRTIWQDGRPWTEFKLTNNTASSVDWTTMSLYTSIRSAAADAEFNFLYDNTDTTPTPGTDNWLGQVGTSAGTPARKASIIAHYIGQTGGWVYDTYSSGTGPPRYNYYQDADGPVQGTGAGNAITTNLCYQIRPDNDLLGTEEQIDVWRNDIANPDTPTMIAGTFTAWRPAEGALEFAASSNRVKFTYINALTYPKKKPTWKVTNYTTSTAPVLKVDNAFLDSEDGSPHTASTHYGTSYISYVDTTNDIAYVQYFNDISSNIDVEIRYSFLNNSPNPPTLVLPLDGSYTSDETPTLSANYSDSDPDDTGKTYYRIATSSANCLAGIVVASGNSPETSSNNENTEWTPSSSIGDDGTYYWCAQNDDGVAQSSWTEMGSFILDTSPPSVSVTSIEEGTSPDYQYVSGTNVIYYNTATSSGSFTVNATATDSESGIEKVNFPALANFDSPNGGDVASSPYFFIYNWTSSSTQNGEATITAYNNANSTTTATFYVYLDADAPSGGSIDYTDGYYTTASVDITYTLGEDSGSSLDTSTGKVQRREATLSEGNCISWIGWLDLVTEFDGSYTDTTVDSGKCYQYRYLISDNVFNQAIYTSDNTAKIDTSTPDIVAVDAGPSSTDRTSLTSDTWFNYFDAGSDDQISFSWTDPNSLSDDVFYYELNATSSDSVSGDETTTTTPYVDGIAISEGTSYFHAKPKNGTGTWGIERIFVVKYDKTDPSVPTYNTAENQWVNLSPTLDIDFSDNLALEKVEYKIDNSGTYRTIAETISGTVYTTDWQISSDDWDAISEGTHYLYFRLTDDAGNQYETPNNEAGFTLGKDISAPTCSISLIEESSVYAYTSSSTLYYNSASSGSFSVNVTATNGESGIQKVNFPNTVSTGGDDTTSPYSWDYNWDSSDTYSQSANITCYNNTGGSQTASLTITRDVTAPSGGSITYTDGYYTTTSVSITYTLGADSGPGLDYSTGKIQRREADLFNGSCSSFGSWSDLATESDGSYTDTSVVSDKCYQYQYLISDNVSNQVTYSSSNIAKIDTLSPTDVSISSITANSSSQLTITATATDSDSGLHATPYWFNETSDNPGVSSSTDWEADSTFVDDGLSPNTQYTYQVKARDAAGNESSFSSTSSKYTLANIPSNLTGSADSRTQITASWNANSNPSGTEYFVENITANTNSDWITNTSWVSSGLSCGTNYSFRVKTRNNDSPNVETVFTGSVSASTNSCITVPTEVTPPEVPIEELVPKEAPLAFQGKWKLLTYTLENLSFVEFTLAPLPKEFRVLAEKFPELDKTFKEVGITKITDIEKLKTVNLTLPGLRKIKKEIPAEIIFAKTGKENIDLEIVLSVTDKGEPQQKISTISGKPLQLLVKPDKQAKSVKGYVVFKSKRITNYESRIMNQDEFSMIHDSKFTIQNLIASLFFAVPSFAKEHNPVEIETRLVLLEFEYTDSDGDGIYTAEIQAPVVEAEYEIITVMDYKDSELGQKEIRLITVVDPEGYVFERIKNQELRITGAIVSLYWLNPETKQYELWPAKEYQQENPQSTDDTGKYSFLVPEGTYYLKVEHPAHPVYQSETFAVKEGNGIHISIELKTKYWWLKVIDWKTILLIVVILLLLYNFYRDKIREKLLKKP